MKAAVQSRDPFDALGNPHRRAIVELLAGRPRSVQQIADRLPISRPAVSRHLRLLSQAGLVTDEQVGARRLYRLDEPGAEAARRYIAGVWGAANARFRIFAENTKPRRR
ncbi:MAG TPA: metalloregulator ArsR/SmtB family transcription factor [Candidatus Dormibacteraeota bacterium]|nr:metalloregulator ArsR/SmtB family transcription factor [Candidatus Dormibacteraeota bacterium]